MYYKVIATLFTTFLAMESVRASSGALCPNRTLMENCVKTAEDDWDLDRNNKESGTKEHCCFQWQAYECQMDLGYKCQGKYDKKVFNESMVAIHTSLGKECTDWPEDKCSGMRWWAVMLIVIACLAAGGLLIYIVLKVLKRNRRRGKRYMAAAPPKV